MKIKEKLLFLALSGLTVATAGTVYKPNILWHDSASGAMKYMPLTKMIPNQSITITDTSNTNLLPKGTGDFTGDGKPDIMFHNQNSGMVRVWEMDGTRKVANHAVLASSNTNLKVAGVGDFDGDGDADIATFNTASGAFRIWVMDGLTRVENRLVLSGANTNLVPNGVGDMNNDGVPDIVLRNNNSGKVRVWTMASDMTRIGNVAVTSSSNTNLELRGIVDVNSDGNNDILNYNTNTGKLRAWLMDGNFNITNNAAIVLEDDKAWSPRGGVTALFAEEIHYVSNVAQFRQALEDASVNGSNDTIVLAKGVYKTNSDGLGTFTYDDDEAYNLTIISAEDLTYDDVRLDGNGTNQIFNFNNSAASTLTLEGISVINGRSESHGGGVYCNQNIMIYDCNISDNLADLPSGGGGIPSGGGFYANGISIVGHSVISGNFAYGYGGGFYDRSNITVIDSEIHDNISRYSAGGGFYAYGSVTVKNTSIIHNGAKDGHGGGFYAHCVGYGDVLVTDSNISENYSWGGNEGGGFYAAYAEQAIVKDSTIAYNYATNKGAGFSVSGKVLVSNSVFSGNYVFRDGGSFYASSAIVVNSLFDHNKANTSGSIFYARGNSFVVNNNFMGNEGSIHSQGAFINNIFDANNENISLFGDSKVYNNYIDYAKIMENGRNIIKKSNLQPVSAGDLYLEDDNLTLTASSPVIEKGLNPSDQKFEDIINEYDNDDEGIYDQIVELLKTDYFGNNRVYNGTIDMGASEYSSGK